MGVRTRPCRDRGAASRGPDDRGAVDVSVEMLFGFVAVLFVTLLLFETIAFWHTRNVFGEAAAEGVRVAAAHDGTCSQGVLAARTSVREAGGRWAKGLRVTCFDGPVVTVVVTGLTPGVLGKAVGMKASVAESAPKER